MVRRLGQWWRHITARGLMTRRVLARAERYGVLSRRDERAEIEVLAAEGGQVGKRKYRPDAALCSEQQAQQHPQNSRPGLQGDPPSNCPGEYLRGLQACG